MYTSQDFLPVNSRFLGWLGWQACTREEESDAVELQLKKNIIRNMK